MTNYEALAQNMLDSDASTPEGLAALKEYAALPLDEKFKVLPILDHLREQRDAEAEKQRAADCAAMKEAIDHEAP
jgi:hypothetical protein